MAIININGQDFNTNPQQINPKTVFKGVIWYKNIQNNILVDVYEFSEKEVIKLAKKFKKIEPSTYKVVIYGPEECMCEDRELLLTVMI